MVLLLILIGFITVIAFTHGLSRQSAQYNFYLSCFAVYLIICFIALCSALIRGANIKYGDSFTRKVYLYDPEKETYSNVIDDGTYVIKNGTIIGR